MITFTDCGIECIIYTRQGASVFLSYHHKKGPFLLENKNYFDQTNFP